MASKLSEQAFPSPRRPFDNGLTIREYVAIQLSFPDSRNIEIDDMIRRAIAAKTGKSAFTMPERQ